MFSAPILVLDRVEQDHLQIASVDRVLRPRIAGGAPAWLRPDELTELVVIAEFGGLDRGFGQGIAETEFDEFARRIWLQIDAKADVPSCRRPTRRPAHRCPRHAD